ncbi:MAG TPA: hypothetical protein VIM00_05385 [Candidatus Acidoferrum sp.]
MTNSLLHEKPWTVGLSPLAALIPLVTAGHWLNEKRFSRKWSRVLEGTETAQRPLWEVAPYELALFAQNFSLGKFTASFGAQVARVFAGHLRMR